MVDVKIRDLPDSGALAATDLLEVTKSPSSSPSSVRATLARVRAAIAASWLDLITTTVASLPTSTGGNWTIGVQFCALRSGQLCTGLRFYWGGSVARTIKCSLYKTGVGLLATANVSVTAAGLYTASWAGVAIDGTSDWYVAIYETSATEYQPHITLSARVPARPLALNYLFIQGGSYSGGDAIPTGATRPSTDSFLVEPIVEG